MAPITTKPQSNARVEYLLRKNEDRAEILKKVRGMWRNRRPDPIKELKKIRKEWNRNPV
ncbi:MAG: hypothetical protein G01um101470_935 [Parcubacteria group bacterium Gr01-1014_70]|nr:MAG: hypothetical protein G01um101470_935 [Parcubacteria group bacterium Gr01-1014_70]